MTRVLIGSWKKLVDMNDTRDGMQRRIVSPGRVLLILALGGVAWLAAMLFVLQISRVVGARHAKLEGAVSVELELVRANLGYTRVLNRDPSTSPRIVENYLARAEWYVQQLVNACARRHGAMFVAPMTPLRRRLARLQVELLNFRELTWRRLQDLDASNRNAADDAAYDEAFRKLALRSREAKAAADEVISLEQRVLNTLQVTLIVGAALLATFVAVALLGYARRWHETAKALQEAEQRFQCLYRDSSDAIMLLDENSFFDCNEATLQVFQFEGYKEFCRKHPADLSPLKQPDGSDSVTRANEHIAQALREGSDRFEWTHKRLDGTEFPAEVLLSAIHLDGRKVLQAVVRDVSQRKISEQQLRSHEAKLRTISEAALDAVVMMDAEGTAVHWNPAAERMFGYTEEEALGQNIHNLLTPERLRDGAAQALSQFFVTGEGRAVGRILELQAVRKSGEEFPIEISVAPIRIDNAWCAVAVIRDITDRKLADQKLRAEQHTLRRLLKAHDQERKLIAYEIHDGLTQQLVAAIMQCQAVVGNEADDKDVVVSDLLDVLQSSLSETRRLIAGLRPPILDEFGVVTAIEGLIEETRLRGGPTIEFRNEVDFQRLEPVLENTIYRVIQESLANACRHSESDRVLIALARKNEHIQITVQDWGIGFDPQQVDRSCYGLAGIRERVRLLGGNVTIESEAGTGTLVSIELPIDVGDLSE